MKAELAERLIELNRVFYEDNARSFSSTRYAIQPGVRKLLPTLLQARSILDLGCGNGNLAIALEKAGFEGFYHGVDNSQGLLAHARTSLAGLEDRYQFSLLDITQPEWKPLPIPEPFDLVCSFATLHHIPGEALQKAFFRQASQYLKNGGKLIFSCWQPLNSPRLRARLQDWTLLDINENEIEEGDLLLDWRADDQSSKQRLRYVHQFNSEKLKNLGEANKLRLEEECLSDGKEGNLGLYQIWRKP